MINNELYKDLGDQWFDARHDAIALLRIEGRMKNEWAADLIAKFQSKSSLDVLDVGCGGGAFLLHLHSMGHRCTGVDVSESILEVGRRRNSEIQWKLGQSESLPLASASFDVVCILDVLEHVEDPRKSIQECVRVLRPGGILLFHTFNRTWMSWLLAAKGLDWFIRNSPKHIHDWNMFIPPQDLEQWLRELGMTIVELGGVRPRFSLAMFKLLVTGRVPEDFSFTHTSSLQVGYMGAARRET